MKRPIRENLDGVNSISYYTGQLEEYIDYIEAELDMLVDVNMALMGKLEVMALDMVDGEMRDVASCLAKYGVEML